MKHFTFFLFFVSLSSHLYGNSSIFYPSQTFILYSTSFTPQPKPPSSTLQRNIIHFTAAAVGGIIINSLQGSTTSHFSRTYEKDIYQELGIPNPAHRKAEAENQAQQAQYHYQEFLKGNTERREEHFNEVQKTNVAIKTMPVHHLASATVQAEKDYHALQKDYDKVCKTIEHHHTYLRLYNNDSQEFYEHQKEVYPLYQQRDLLADQLSLKKHHFHSLNNALSRYLKPYQNAYHNFFNINKQQSLAVVQERAREYARLINRYSHQKQHLLEKEHHLIQRKNKLAQKYTSVLGKVRKLLGGGREFRKVSKELAECQHALYHCEDYRQKVVYEEAAAYKVISQQAVAGLVQQMHNDLSSIAQSATINQNAAEVQRLQRIASALHGASPEQIKEREYHYVHYTGSHKHEHTFTIVTDPAQDEFIKEDINLLEKTVDLKATCKNTADYQAFDQIDGACHQAIDATRSYDLPKSRAFTLHAQALHTILKQEGGVNNYALEVQYAVLQSSNAQHTRIECHQKRVEAAQKVLEKPSFYFHENYTLSPTALNQLQALELSSSSLTSFVGDPLQHQLHTEIIYIIEEASYLRTRYTENPSVQGFGALTLTCADGAHTYNQNKQIGKSIQFINWCYDALDVVNDVIIGGAKDCLKRNIEFVKDIVHLVTHPQDIPPVLVKIGKAASSFVQIMGSIQPLDLEWCMEMDNGLELYERRQRQVNENYKQIQLALKETWNSTSSRDKARGCVSFALDWILPAKICKAGSIVTKTAAQELKNLAVPILNKLQLAHTAPLSALLLNVHRLQQAEQIAVKVPFIEAIFKEICEDAQALARLDVTHGIDTFIKGLHEGHELVTARKAAQVFKEVLSPLEVFYNNKLHLKTAFTTEQVLHHHAQVMNSIMNFYEAELAAYETILKNAAVDAETLLNVIQEGSELVSVEKVKKIFSNIVPNKQHIFSLEAQTKAAGLKLKGFHSDPHGLLQKSGIFNFTEYRELTNGLYEAKVGFLDHVKNVASTFFPTHWDPKMVGEKILESWKNPTLFQLQRGCYTLEGLTHEGIKIRSIIKESGEIITHYPIKP